jgi:hypothetical protein
MKPRITSSLIQSLALLPMLVMPAMASERTAQAFPRPPVVSWDAAKSTATVGFSGKNDTLVFKWADGQRTRLAAMCGEVVLMD